MNKIDLSIVIPAYNEEHRIKPTLASLQTYFNQLSINYEVIIVDDGSRDNLNKGLNSSGLDLSRVRILSYPLNQGKGYAVRFGIANAEGELILMADADGATPFSEYEKLRLALDKGFDIACGSRALYTENVRLKTPLYRKLIGRIYSLFVRSILGLNIKDTQCGFKLFRKNCAKSIFSIIKSNNFSFDVEVLYQANKQGYKIIEVPVNWENVEGSKVNLVSDSTKMFFDLLKIRFFTV